MQLDPVVVFPSLGLAAFACVAAALAKFSGVALPALTILKKRDTACSSAAILAGISFTPTATDSGGETDNSLSLRQIRIWSRFLFPVQT